VGPRERPVPPGVVPGMDRDPKFAHRWIVLSVPAPPRGEEHLLVEALIRVGGRSVVREGDRYVARIPVPRPEAARADAVAAEEGAPGDPAPTVANAEAAIRASTSLRDPDLRWEWAEDGPGSGESTPRHPTTRACLALLGELVAPGERWLDVGAGTGVLALEAARLGAEAVLALEMDPVAAALARESAADAPGARVRVVTLRAGPGDLRRLGPFHGIVANIEARALMELLDAFRGEGAPLHPGGHLILSGAHRGEGRDLAQVARDAGLTAVTERVEEGWWTGAFRYGGVRDPQ
jgi:precorrin-6B methylase 2